MANKAQTGQKTARSRKGNPRGRALLPPEFKHYAEEAADRLRAIADDPETPVKIKTDIDKWFAEMWFGKSPQALGLEGEVKTEAAGVQVIRFEGELEEWSQ